MDFDNRIQKLKWKTKLPRVFKTLLESSKLRKLAMIDIKTYYKTIMIREYGAGTGVDKESNGTE